MDAVGQSVVLFGEVVVGGAASRDAKLGLAQLGDVAGAGREEHRLLDVVFVHNLEPGLNLLGRTHAPVIATVTKGIEQLRVERLIGRPEARLAAVSGRVPIFSDVHFAVQHKSLRVYYGRPVNQVFSPSI